MRYIALLVLLSAALRAQTESAPWKSLAFLEGTWEAKTNGGSSAAASTGTYTFSKDLKGRVLARHSSATTCKGPADFDCDHGDLLYVFQDAANQPLKAIYFDNEGHVIHYDVSNPSASSVVFLSDGSAPGPRFRLTYELKNGLMSGKFQMQMPGQSRWTPYLEWSGSKK